MMEFESFLRNTFFVLMMTFLLCIVYNYVMVFTNSIWFTSVVVIVVAVVLSTVLHYFALVIDHIGKE